MKGRLTLMTLLTTLGKKDGSRTESYRNFSQQLSLAIQAPEKLPEHCYVNVIVTRE